MSVGNIVLEAPCDELIGRPEELRRAYLQGGAEAHNPQAGNGRVTASAPDPAAS